MHVIMLQVAWGYSTGAEPPEISQLGSRLMKTELMIKQKRDGYYEWEFAQKVVASVPIDACNALRFTHAQ